MNSKYTGQQVEALLDTINQGGDTSAKLGEVKMSSSAGNLFGDDYVLASGGNVDLNQYPQSAGVLPVTGINNARTITYSSMADAPYVDMEYTMFKAGAKLARLRQTAIPPAGGTTEDYINMFRSMTWYLDVSTDGENWVQKCRMPKPDYDTEGTCMYYTPTVIGNQLIVFGKVAKMKDDMSGYLDMTYRIVRTYDLDSFRNWDSIPFTLPGLTSEGDVEFKSIAYGKGIYFLIVSCGNKCAPFVSTDSFNWQYATSVMTEWDTQSNWEFYAYFIGERFLIQYGQVFMVDTPSEISADKIVNPDALGEDIDGGIVDVSFESLPGMDAYMVISQRRYIYMIRKVDGKWKSSRVDTGATLGGTGLIAMTGKYPDTLFLCAARKYMRFGSESATTLVIDGSSSNLRTAFFFGTHIYMKDESGSNIIGDVSVSTPDYGALINLGIYPYIKLK